MKKWKKREGRTYHIGILGKPRTESSGRILAPIEPPNFEGEHLGQHPLPHPLRQVLPHGPKIVVLRRIDGEGGEEEEEEQYGVAPRLRLYLLVVDEEVGRHHAAHGVGVHRLHRPERRRG